MKKLIAMLLILSLCLAAGCSAVGQPGDTVAPGTAPAASGPAGGTGVSEDLLPAPEEEAAEPFPDFTVTTTAGETFTLSQVRQEKDLVFINLFATWCPPCAMEFPYLEQAWEEYRDRVAVIALSVDPEDTDEMLSQYAEEKGLTFAVANGSDTELISYLQLYAVPTSALVDRAGNLVWTETGAQESKEAFEGLFDRYLQAPDEDTVSYRVRFVDQNGEPVPGCVINFCTDTACTPVTSDETGVALFQGAPAAYHLQVVQVPQGYSFDTAQGYYTEARAQNLIFQVTAD